MRLIFLNTWEGIVGEKLKDFIEKQSLNTEIFCFQEANKNFNSLIKKSLVNYHLVHGHKSNNNNNKFFQETYIRKDLNINLSTTLLSNELDTGLCLYTQVQFNNKILNICNVHGNALPGDKLDNLGRLKQSQIIIDFLKKISGPKIIGGDFNLEFDTQSVKMFEDNGYKNLIKDYKISTTRNNIAWEKYPNNKQYFADFTFISPDIKVLDFSVPNLEISDHLPMILEI